MHNFGKALTLRFVLSGALLFVCFLFPHYAHAVTYNFNSDTLGQPPANTTTNGGSFSVQDEAMLGYSLHGETANGFVAGITFDSFASTTDQSVVWKQAYSNTTGRSGFTLRAQSEFTAQASHTSARRGYFFHVYENSYYIWRVTSAGFVQLSTGSLTKAEPRWFRALVQGNALGFYYSNDGTTYTRLASTTDSTYTSGIVQYTTGYGTSVQYDYVDDVVITNLGVDSAAPSVSTLSPADNATSVSTTANLVITFDENVDVETGNISIYKSSDDSLVEAIDVTSGLVTGTGTNIITINPSVTFEESTQYYVQVAATAFDDPSSNSYAGISNSTSWNFTTGDFTNPSVTGLSPTDEQTNVAIYSNLVITFTENVDAETGNISIYKSLDDSLVEAIDVTGGLVTGSGTNSITINPTADLENGVSYYVQVAATAFDDAASNSYAGIANSTTWNFTTLALDEPEEEEEIERTPRRNGGSSVSTRVNNLIQNGNTQLAQELIAQYPNVFDGQVSVIAALPANIPTPLDRNCVLGTITKTLRAGMEDEEVRALQKFLNCAGFILASSGAGSPGNETNLFSVRTYLALQKFQEKYASEILYPVNVTSGTGIFGELSRKKAEALLQ